MNRKYTAALVPVLALGAIAFTASEATAIVKDPRNDGQSGVVVLPEPRPVVQVPVDDTWTEAAQAGASALGGAAIAFGALWLYRRRQPLAG